MSMADIPRMADELQVGGYSTVTLPSELFAQTLALAQQFFAFDAKVQMSALASISSGVLGFYPSEETVANLEGDIPVVTLRGARARGYSSFDFIDDAIVGVSSVLRKNAWPNELFRMNAAGVYRAVAEESRRLSVALLDYLADRGWVRGLGSEILAGSSCSLMRLLSYECRRTPIVSKAHSDYELLSFILTEGPGLQVKNANGDWVDLQVEGPSAIVLAGDMAEALTSGRIQSPLHRVRLENGTRTSVIFFQGLPLGTRLSYSRGGIDCPPTFGAHILPLLARGAAHLAARLEEIEGELGCEIPTSNLFKSGK